MPMVEVSPFASLRQVEAGDLSVGYAELGPGDGPAVLLLHGWPYDIHAYAEVAPILADAGYRVIVPHLRGYGTTRFRKDDAPGTRSRRRSVGTPSSCSTRSTSIERSSAASTGERARPMSWRRRRRIVAPGSYR